MRALFTFLLLIIIAGTALGVGLSRQILKEVRHKHPNPPICHQWDRGNHTLSVPNDQHKTYVKTVNSLGLQNRTVICKGR